MEEPALYTWKTFSKHKLKAGWTQKAGNIQKV